MISSCGGAYFMKHHTYPYSKQVRAYLASFWECFTLRMNEEKLIWHAFCERENLERGGRWKGRDFIDMQKGRECLRVCEHTRAKHTHMPLNSRHLGQCSLYPGLPFFNSNCSHHDPTCVKVLSQNPLNSEWYVPLDDHVSCWSIQWFMEQWFFFFFLESSWNYIGVKFEIAVYRKDFMLMNVIRCI